MASSGKRKTTFATLAREGERTPSLSSELDRVLRDIESAGDARMAEALLSEAPTDAWVA